MKFRVTVFLLAIVSLASLSACKMDGNPQSHANDETGIVDSAGFPDEYKSEAHEYESADRVIWQKPDLVIQQLGDVEGKTVADLGAGTGYFSRRIAYKGARVIAIDIDPLAIQWMEEQKEKFPIELQD